MLAKLANKQMVWTVIVFAFIKPRKMAKITKTGVQRLMQGLFKHNTSAGCYQPSSGLLQQIAIFLVKTFCHCIFALTYTFAVCFKKTCKHNGKCKVKC